MNEFYSLNDIISERSVIPSQADWKDGFKKKNVGVSDMTLLTTISDESVNDNLQKRWTAGEIYTYIGSVLISVNPFRGSQMLIVIIVYLLICPLQIWVFIPILS